MEKIIDSGNKVDFHIHSIASKHKESDDCVDLSTIENIDILIKSLNDRKLDLMFNTNYKGFVGDITDEAFISKSINEIAKLGKIKYLVNNAQKTCFKEVTDYSAQDIQNSLDALKGMIICTEKTLKVKNEQDLKIINIMSSAALKGNKKEALYCATKWGERGYTESLKVAYKGTSVKVIGVYSGGMNTQFWKESGDYVTEEQSNTFMNPKDVAAVILNNILNYDNLTVSDLMIERN